MRTSKKQNNRVVKIIDPFGNIIGLIGSAADANKRTVEEQPSETAMSSTFCLALAFKEDRDKIKVPDYLAEDAIDTVLNFIRNNSANGSFLCFDYMTEILESVNAAEPFRFWIDKKTFLSEHNYKITTHMDSDEMEKKYLTLQDGSLAEKALTRFCFIHATVSK